jgi:signal transduction histidine kinase
MCDCRHVLLLSPDTQGTLGAPARPHIGGSDDLVSLARAIFRGARIARAADVNAARVRYLAGMALTRLVRSHSDLLLALGLTVIGQAEIWLGEPEDHRAVYAALALLVTMALAWRVRAPLVALVVAAGVFLPSAILFPLSGESAFAVPAALLIAVYSIGAHTEGWRTVAGVLVGIAVVFAVTFADPEGADPGSYLFFLFVVGGPWLAGRAIRHRRLSERHLEARALTAEREREERARAAVAEERVRIARELHDVVAHAISVIVVQARGGRRSLATEPEEAREAFDSIEASGVEALAEMRRLLGMLRKGNEELALAPQPSLRHLDTLVAQVKEAGLPVELTVEGEPTALPPGVDLSAYRIVQEALTNALKHAGPATACVLVRYGSEDLEVEVTDTGRRPAGGDGAGHGLVGMRERVTLFGGQLEAGRRGEGGFVVRARLPLASERP